ncbi:TPA: ABC-2 transporter permease [Clostridioides difficile]
MIGLIKKDFLLIKKSFTPIYLFAIIIAVLPLIKNPTFLVPIMSLVLFLLFSSQLLVTFNLDELANWNKNISAMPISIYKEIASKYIVSFILSILPLLILILLSILTINSLNVSKGFIIYCIISGFMISCLYNSIVIPAAFKFGTNKCRLILFIFVGVLTIIPILLNSLNIQIDYSSIKLSTSTFLVLSILAILIITIISYTVSIKIKR